MDVCFTKLMTKKTDKDMIVGLDIGTSKVVAIVGENSYKPDSLNYGTAYTWQVNEVNETTEPATYVGNSWTFTTPDVGVISTPGWVSGLPALPMAAIWPARVAMATPWPE